MAEPKKLISFEPVFKPIYVDMRCACSKRTDGLAIHIIFHFDTFGTFTSRFAICVECGGCFKDIDRDIGDASFDGFAQSALQHRFNETWVH